MIKLYNTYRLFDLDLKGKTLGQLFTYKYRAKRSEKSKIITYLSTWYFHVPKQE